MIILQKIQTNKQCTLHLAKQYGDAWQLMQVMTVRMQNLGEQIHMQHGKPGGGRRDKHNAFGNLTVN